MAKTPKRSSAKTRKGKPGTAATTLKVAKGPDGKVLIDTSDIPAKPLPSVRETVDALSKAIPDPVATSKRAKAARAGAHPPIPEAAGDPETAPGSAKLPTGEETTGPKAERPTDYSDDLADDLLEHMGNGGSAASWCAVATHWRYATLLRHLAARPEFAKSYARAREAHADAIFDQCLDIADETQDDWIETDKGGKRFNNEAAARSRVRIDTRMKIAGRLNPARYAETSNLNLDDKRPSTAEERQARINQLLLAGVPKPAEGAA